MTSNNTRTRSRTTIAVTAAGLTLLGAAWFGHSALSGQPDARVDAQASQLGASSIRGERGSTADRNAPCSFSAGMRMAYDVRTTTRIELDLGRLSNEIDLGKGNVGSETTEAQQHAVTRQWHLDLEAVAVDDDGTTVLAAHIEDRGGEAEGAGSIPPQANLADTFLVRVAPRCSIREFGWRTEGDLDIAHEQQVLASALGFWAPAPGQTGVYGGRAFDATGAYNATYRNEGGGEIEGEAVEYRGSFATTRGLAALEMEVESSSIAVELAQGAWFRSLSNARELTLSMVGQAIGTHGRTTEAELVDPGAWRAAVDPGDGGWTFGLLLGRHQSGRQQQPADERLAQVSLTDALSQYQQMVAERRSTAESAGFLKQWMLANPEAAPQLVGLLRDGAFDDDQLGRSGLFLALGTVGLPSARRALVELVGSTADRTSHQIGAAFALAQSPNATPDLVELMSDRMGRGDLHPTERRSMAMAVGLMAKRNAEAHPEVAQAARAQIEGWFDEASDDEHQIAQSLLAAGNAGHDDMAGLIEPYIGHDNPEIRERAVHALRQMSPEAAFGPLEDGLLDDSLAVRMRAMGSATTVSRQHDVAVPATMVELARDSLPQAQSGERDSLLALLREASRHGNAQADDALRSALHEQLDAEHPDPRQLATLGRAMGGHWEAGR